MELNARVIELETALNLAIEALEECMGSDAEDSETVQYLNRVLFAR